MIFRDIEGVWVANSKSNVARFIYDYDVFGCGYGYWAFECDADDIKQYGSLKELLPHTLTDLNYKYCYYGCSGGGYEKEELDYMLEVELGLPEELTKKIKGLLE